MVAEDLLLDPQVRRWLDGVEPAWTLLTLDSLRALRPEPSADANTIRVASNLNADETADSASIFSRSAKLIGVPEDPANSYYPS
jgi:hypothetical protein